MNNWSIVIPAYLVTAGIMLYGGIQTALMRFVGQPLRLYSVFAVLCFCAAGYQLATAGYYLADSVPGAASALHWQMLFLCIAMVAFFAFVCIYTGQQHYSRWLAVLALVFAGLFLADLLAPYSLRFQSMVLARPMRLPWGETLGAVSGRGPMDSRSGIFLPFLAVFLWALRRAAVLYRGGERGKGAFLAACITLLIASGIWGLLIDTGVVRSFYVAGFAFIGLIVLMSAGLGMTQLGTMEALRAERDRLHETQRALERSELRMSLVLKGTNDPWWDWNIITGEQYYSPRGWAMLGYADQELPYDGELWNFLVYPEDRAYGQQMLAEAIESGRENYSFEMRLRHRDGHPVPVYCRGYILRDATGRALRVSGTDTDLTSRKQAEDALRRERELNEQVIARSPVGICIYDTQGNCITANEVQARQIGASVDQVLRQNFHRIESWKTSGLYACALKTLRSGEPTSQVIHVRTSFGRDVWQAVNFSVLHTGGVGHLMQMTVDLTAYKRVEQDRKEIQESFEMLFANSMDAVLQTRPNGEILAANPAACAMLGMSEQEIQQRGRSGILDTSDPRLPLMLEERARCGRARGELTLIRGNGERFEAEISSAIYKGHGGGAFTSMIMRDITARKQAEADTHRLAYFDSLTGLPNRRLLLDRIAQSLEAARRSSQMGALLFLDLDNFKHINDARGHSVGDRFLALVAQRLTQLLRSVDLVSRLGGDEFVILVNDLGSDVETAARVAMAVAEKVRTVLESPYLIDDYLYSGTGSIGLTMFPKNRDAVDDLLREADTAMYRAKSMGRNRIAYYETAMQAEVEERLALEQDLKEALDAGQISVHVQPQVDASGLETGGELLLRWRHPERGDVSPAFFIPIAEESGFILRLGDMVVRHACEALARMHRAGMAHTLSVNISPRQFRQEDFVDRIRAMLEDTGAPAARLIFEVTEGLLIEDWEDVASRMAQLSAMGVRFSIDDFGTGYSSLAYLKKLPLHELKIDKSFVQHTPDSPNDRAIVRSILAVARAFKLKVVAEGVETQAQADFLAKHHCQCLQGHLYAWPQPLDAWLSRRIAETVGNAA